MPKKLKKKPPIKKLKMAEKVSKKKPTKRALKKVFYIQKGYHSITPYLIMKNCAAALEFYKKAFAAKELFRMENHGQIKHAEIKIGDARLMLADSQKEMSTRSPEDCKGSCVGIHLYVKNVDDVVAKAIALGAILEKPIETYFYGDRNGTLKDPYGHIWHISTHVENVTPAQFKKRVAKLFG